MARARDDHTFHDAGFGGHLNELTPEQRKARDEFQKEQNKAAGEAAQQIVDSFSKSRKPDIMDAMVAVENHKASLTPEEERRSRFVHFPEPKPSEQDENSFDDAEHEALMRSIEEEEARETENLWNVDDEDDGQIGPPYHR